MFQPLLFALTLLASSLFLNVSAAPSAPILSKRAPANVITKCKVNGTIALTFDDGPSVYTDAVVAELKKFDAKATFFVNGNNFGCIYDQPSVDRLQMLMKGGHQIASHTWSHTNLSLITRDQAHNQLYRVEEAMFSILGVKPNIVRPPYGAYNENITKVAGERFQDIVLWDFDSDDSSIDPLKANTTAIVAKYKAQLGTLKKTNAHLLPLQHDVKDTAAPVLAQILPILKKMKLKPVTVAECLGKPLYQQPPNPKFKAKRDATWTCTGKPKPGKP